MLEVSTASFCPINCQLCPQTHYIRAGNGLGIPRFLSLTDFQGALDNVSTDVQIAFSGYSEPFCNSRCLDMIEYAHRKGHGVILYSTLFGLKPEDVPRLARIPLYFFVLHLPDNLGNTHIPLTEQYKETLVRVLSTIHRDGYSVHDENMISHGRAGLTEGSRQFHRRGLFLCTKLRLPMFVMIPNCDVTLCCMDFGLKHILGNLLRQSFDEIASGSTYQSIRANRFRLDGDVLCRSCIWGSVKRNALFSVYRTFKRVKRGVVRRIGS